MTDKLSEAAKKLGLEHGRQRADWIVEAKLDGDGAKALLDGYDSGDLNILALCPDPLSGEWAGDPTIASTIEEIAKLAEAKELIEHIDIEDAINQADSILDDYEAAFKEGFWQVVIFNAKKIK